MEDTVTSQTIRSSKLSYVVLCALCFLTLTVGIIRGASIPFWADELSTVHIAEVPVWKQMVQLNQTMDLNPPFEPTLVWLSMRVFGPHEFAGRLPSVISFAIAVACVFLYLHRRVPLWFAAAGALLMLYNEQISYYATETRPYALLLAMLGIVLLAYDSILHSIGRPWLARLILFLATAGLLLSHLFGLFAVGSFLLAEAIRSFRRRKLGLKLDVWTILALVLPLCCCFLYFSQVHAQHMIVYPEEYRPKVYRGILLYNSLLLKPIAPFVAIALASLLLIKRYPETRFRRFLNLQLEEWGLLLTLFATAAVLAVIMSVRSPMGGFFPRYTMAMVYPAVFFFMAFLAWRSRENLRLGKGLAALALLGALFTYHEVLSQAHHLMRRGLLAAPDEVATSGGVSAIEPDLPLVMNDPHAFLQADQRLSAKDSARMVYVTDDEEAMRVAHANAAETISVAAAAFHLRSPVVPYAEFMAAHSRFLVLGEPDHVSDWFLQSMINHGASVRFMGKYDFAGKHLPLWLVSVQTEHPQ